MFRKTGRLKPVNISSLPRPFQNTRKPPPPPTQKRCCNRDSQHLQGHRYTNIDSFPTPTPITVPSFPPRKTHHHPSNKTKRTLPKPLSHHRRHTLRQEGPCYLTIGVIAKSWDRFSQLANSCCINVQVQAPELLLLAAWIAEEARRWVLAVWCGVETRRTGEGERGR